MVQKAPNKTFTQVILMVPLQATCNPGLQIEGSNPLPHDCSAACVSGAHNSSKKEDISRYPSSIPFPFIVGSPD